MKYLSMKIFKGSEKQIFYKKIFFLHTKEESIGEKSAIKKKIVGFFKHNLRFRRRVSKNLSEFFLKSFRVRWSFDHHWKYTFFQIFSSLLFFVQENVNHSSP